MQCGGDFSTFLVPSIDATFYAIKDSPVEIHA
jgi:hypothetical protein